MKGKRMIFSKYTSEVKTVKEIKNGEVVERQRVIIYIESTDDKGNLIKIPSFLTGFPYNNYNILYGLNKTVEKTGGAVCPCQIWRLPPPIFGPKPRPYLFL